jgi:hypothetical protein
MTHLQETLINRPYGTGRVFFLFPGTSCPATILQFLRDGLQPCKTSKLQSQT